MGAIIMSELILVPLEGRRFYEIDFFKQFEDRLEAIRQFKRIYERAFRVQKHFPKYLSF